MILSTIDLGTNTILMVTLERLSDGTIAVLGDDHEIARLGRGVDAARRILPETFDRVATFLRDFRDRADILKCDRLIAFSTSALRDAANREEFILAMARDTGVTLRVLPASQEAELTYRGALFGLEGMAGDVAVIDIGGGSTELAVGRGINPRVGRSVDIGALRLTERDLPTLPPLPQHVEQARRTTRRILADLPTVEPATTLVGVAGTVTTLAAMALELVRFDAHTLHGTRIRARRISELTEHLLTLGLEAIRAIPQVHRDRADVLTAGAIILDEYLKTAGIHELVVSTCGVRYGVALRELDGVLRVRPYGI